MTATEFRRLMSAAGVTQRGAAKRIGVHLSSVQRWLNGELPISAEKAALIRERLQTEKPADPGAAG